MSYVTLYQVSTDAVTWSVLARDVLRTNAVQIIVSVVCVLYHNALTRMLVAYEYESFWKKFQGLHVSRPQGAQRSTYWLRLPYHYAIPLMVIMILVHWLLSRAFYLVSIRVYDIAGKEDLTRKYLIQSKSALALLLVFVLSTAMLIAMIVLMPRKLSTDMPLLGTCSLAISAACHAAPGDEDAATKHFRYGAVNDWNEQDEEQEQEQEQDQQQDQDQELEDETEPQPRHVCFTSQDVGPLKVGYRYF